MTHMKYPEVNKTFYWEDDDGNIHEDVCLKIENNDTEDIETMFYIYISDNGGGTFVTESDIVDPKSAKVKKYLDDKSKATIKIIEDAIKNNEIKSAVIAMVKDDIDVDLDKVSTDEMADYINSNSDILYYVDNDILCDAIKDPSSILDDLSYAELCEEIKKRNITISYDDYDLKQMIIHACATLSPYGIMDKQSMKEVICSYIDNNITNSYLTNTEL